MSYAPVHSFPVQARANREKYTRYSQRLYTTNSVIPEKLKNYQNHLTKNARQLKDVRVIGMLLFVVVVLLVSWSGVKAINANYALQRHISALEQQNAVKKLANENLTLQNAYYNTPQYLELAARQDYGLAAPGETVLIVPQGVAIAHTVELPQDRAVSDATKVAKKNAFQRNFQSWMDFFMHRPGQ
jgi:cell division protein FtsB